MLPRNVFCHSCSTCITQRCRVAVSRGCRLVLVKWAVDRAIMYLVKHPCHPGQHTEPCYEVKSLRRCNSVCERPESGPVKQLSGPGCDCGGRNMLANEDWGRRAETSLQPVNPLKEGEGKPELNSSVPCKGLYCPGFSTLGRAKLARDGPGKAPSTRLEILGDGSESWGRKPQSLGREPGQDFVSTGN